MWQCVSSDARYGGGVGNIEIGKESMTDKKTKNIISVKFN